MLAGRFVEPEITAGVTPRVEVATEEEPVRRDPPAVVKLRMGQFDTEMTVAQWKLFTDNVNKALEQPSETPDYSRPRLPTRKKD